MWKVSDEWSFNVERCITWTSKVHVPTNALFIIWRVYKSFYIKIHITIAPTWSLMMDGQVPKHVGATVTWILMLKTFTDFQVINSAFVGTWTFNDEWRFVKRSIFHWPLFFTMATQWTHCTGYVRFTSFLPLRGSTAHEQLWKNKSSPC
jgi:hypothetical protein